MPPVVTPIVSQTNPFQIERFLLRCVAVIGKKNARQIHSFDDLARFQFPI
jgi:hypothetical protein